LLEGGLHVWTEQEKSQKQRPSSQTIIPEHDDEHIFQRHVTLGKVQRSIARQKPKGHEKSVSEVTEAIREPYRIIPRKLNEGHDKEPGEREQPRAIIAIGVRDRLEKGEEI
jgi:hypothetical protein